MDFIYLQTFCEVAKWGNFPRAAEALGYAQSSVTTQMQKLEEQYGVILFEHAGRKMQLTQAGEVLLPYARQILTLQAELKTQLTEQHTGTQTIGTIETLAAFYMCGLGIAFLPAETMREDIAQGKLQALAFTQESHLYTQAIYLQKSGNLKHFSMCWT